MSPRPKPRPSPKPNEPGDYNLAIVQAIAERAIDRLWANIRFERNPQLFRCIFGTVAWCAQIVDESA